LIEYKLKKPGKSKKRNIIVDHYLLHFNFAIKKCGFINEMKNDD
jgi:hypothetical protein